MRDGLLVRHFLHRFLDHDLISPNADRRQVLTIAAAMAVVSMLFLAVFTAVKYQFNLFMPPGMTSVLALDDRFLFCSASMLVMALVAVAEWDALALDARDAAILGPLPVPRRTIVRAKFTAVALFAAGFDIALSLGPTIVRPAAVPVRLPVTLGGAVVLMAAHACAAMAAGAFGFLAILALREAVRGAIGPGAFARMSAALQAVLVVFLVTALLLLPRSYSAVALRWFAHPRVPPLAVPPLWFVGLHETLAGHVIDRLSHAAPPRRFAAAERQATQLYRALWPIFHRFAIVAVGALGVALLVAVAACAWNSRRLPGPNATRTNRRRFERTFARIACATVVRRPAAQAGFFFALQSLARSVPHRVTTAAAIAVALSLAVITAGNLDATRLSSLSAAPIGVLALQTWILAVLVAAFRHLVRVPSDARANWVFHLAWSGEQAPYLSGVKRAGVLAIVLPALLVLFAGDAFVFGPAASALHLAAGGCVGIWMMELLFVGYAKLPFASAFVPSEGIKSIGPLFVVSTLVLGAVIAAIERVALSSGASGRVVFFLAWVAAIGVTHAIAAGRQRSRPPIDLDELPADATQRLALVR